MIRPARLLLFGLVMLCLSAASRAQVLVSVNFGPPALPVYEQPLSPGEGYLWMPGYWAWSPYGYYWVPGTWVLVPEPGLLWTPGYWAFDDGLYYWYPGYWAPVVGFYGGIAYGYGYPGTGYYGGHWRGNQFYYNQAVNNVNVTNVHNVYNTTVVNNSTVNRVSYNGGPGGATARPTPEQEAAAKQRQNIPPTSAQIEHEHAASKNHELLASVNQGRPPIAASPKPAEFSGRGIVAAKEAGAPYSPESRTAQPRPEVPRPPNASDRENAPGRENAPSAPREVRPQNPEREPRPENAPNPRREQPPPNPEMHPDRRTPPDRQPPPPPYPQEERLH